MGWTEKAEFNPKEADIPGILHTHKYSFVQPLFSSTRTNLFIVL